MMKFPCFLHLLVLNLLEWNRLRRLREQNHLHEPQGFGVRSHDVDLRGDDEDDEMGVV